MKEGYAFGYPRLGDNREYKKIIESFWNKEINEKTLYEEIKELESQRISTYKKFSLNFPVCEFTLYDNFLDQAFIFGVYPFKKSLNKKSLNYYYKYARGKCALELKKFFNTNYHYLRPHITKKTKFKIGWNKFLDYFKLFNYDIRNPVFIFGPYTFLRLSFVDEDVNFFYLLQELFEIYVELFRILYRNKITNIHLEEPAFVLDVNKRESAFIKSLYKKYLPKIPQDILLVTYYESVEFLKDLIDLPFNGILLDFIDGYNNLKVLKKVGFDLNKKLYAGVIDGRRPLKADVEKIVAFVEKVLLKIKGVKRENLIICNSSPLYLLPLSIKNEEKLPSKLKGKLSFAREKLEEVCLVSTQLQKGVLRRCKPKLNFVIPSTKIFDTLTYSKQEFKRRFNLHKKIFNLPILPTTTIGSFPQDREVRKIRNLYRKGKITLKEYENFIKEKITHLIKLQEQLKLDVFVHGEFERSDMVEFFAQKLEGIFTTQQGWIISYGTRVYRPPIIFDDIRRRHPLTLKEITFAQSLTSHPVKGMLTGPITIFNWSYNISDNPSYKVCFQIGKALNEEIKELIKRGIRIIQIDEPAFREAVPLKKIYRKSYFSWAIRSFNIASKVKEDIQIHTHMCYSEFGEVLNWILKLNFDVITIEASRSRGKILEAFKNKKFYRQIGPGVWDIHSTYVPSQEEIKKIIKKAIQIFGVKQVWVNPDCGLKTRNWKEVIPSLKNMVKSALILRKEYEGKTS